MKRLLTALVIFAGLQSGLFAQTYTTLYTFQGGTDGSAPQGLAFGPDGSLYGATSFGGPANYGTIFKLSQGVKTILYSFLGGADGSLPNGDLLFDSQGNIYGTTQAGGGCCGTVFRLSPAGVKTVLYQFTATTGGNTISGVISDAVGNLYGTTPVGGEYGVGTIYELALQKNGAYLYKTIYQMKPKASTPYGKLTFDSAGNLYATTSKNLYVYFGGIVGLTPTATGWKRTTYVWFARRYGRFLSGLVIDSQGNWYGTSSGGANAGVAYEVTQNGEEFTVLQTFKPAQGCPSPPLAMDSNGNLYGETYNGGKHGYGTIFQLTPYKVLHNFDSTEPIPSWGLIPDTSGNLYGVTEGDGTKTFGSVYEFQP
jgi:uncharacterized repeat protein (TIGR03803 family)